MTTAWLTRLCQTRLTGALELVTGKAARDAVPGIADR
jgi:hypothetical protein